MGFRTGAYATIWEVVPTPSNSFTRARISTSKKNRDTGEYETDFSGYVGFCGSGVSNRVLKLQPRQRIRLGDVEVTNSYNKERGITYTNYNIYSFEAVESKFSNQQPQGKTVVPGDPVPEFVEVEEDPEGLPF